MNQEDFNKLFEQYQKPALNVVMWRFNNNRDLADDAVQSATEYLLGRLDTLDELTESYFIQLVVNRARNIKRGRTRQYMRVLPQGHGHDLDAVEEQEWEKRYGRAYDPNSRLDE